MTEELQKFKCVVDELTSTSVWVSLSDLTNPTNPPEVAEIMLENFDEQLKSLLVEGFIFWWHIGYETKENGQIIRISEFIHGRIWSTTLSKVKGLQGDLQRKC